MKTIHHVSIGIFLGVCAVPISAISGDVDGLLSRQYVACMDKTDGVTAKMLECMAAESKVQDAMLTNAYRKLLGQLTPERRKELIEVQRSWIRFREGNCKFYANPDGGTLAIVAASGCSLSAIALRAAELEGLAEQQ